MVLRLLLISMLTGAAASVMILVFSGPLWLALLAYPATGTVTLLGAIAVAGLGGRGRQYVFGASVSPPASVHCPVPRSTTATVASNTLISVASESLRS
jgi:hypothetical protein